MARLADGIGDALLLVGPRLGAANAPGSSLGFCLAAYALRPFPWE